MVACLWEQQTLAEHVQRIVPDGCVDLVWLAGAELVVAGADTGPRVMTLPAGTRASGIRLRPGAAGAALGMPASQVRDLVVPATLAWGAPARRLQEELAEASPSRRLELLAQAVAQRAAQPDPIVRAAAARLAAPAARVRAVAAALGVSDRHLHRRVLAAVGYGPKTLARVARLRLLVALGTDEPLAARAYTAGYSSQAHMNEDVRRLTGMTPVRFLKDAALPAA
jgi:methylphosphotriester-DNA--protein-cysteine methyltransferase